jgi:ATP-dependent DNA helicase RecG
MDLTDLISKGERIDVEFKSWEKMQNKKEFMRILVKESVAMANTKGGKFY